MWIRVIGEDAHGVIDVGLIDGGADDSCKEAWESTMANGVLVLASNVTLRNLTLSRLHVGVEIRGDNVTVEGWSADMLSGDIFQGSGSNVKIMPGVVTNAIEVLPFERYHPDITHFRAGSGGLIDGIEVIPSKHKWARKDYQGCMFSDNSFKDWTVSNLKLPGVHPEHAVTFAEAHSCCVHSVWGGGSVRFRDLNGRRSTGCRAYNIDGPIFGAEGTEMIDIDGIMKGEPEAPKQSSIDSLIQSTASRLEVEPELLEALIEQESLKEPFYKGNPTILFERHVFTQLLNNNGVDINKLIAKMPETQDIIGYKPYKKYGTFAKQQSRFQLACRISDELAIGACSWGAFSVMGFHWEALGLSSPQELQSKAQTVEGQFELMVGYVEHVEPRALGALRAKDFDSFKYFYNGPAKNDYAAEFAQKYRRALARNQPKKSIAKGKSRTMNTQTVDVAQKTVGFGGLFALYHSMKGQLAEIQNEVVQMSFQDWVIVAAIVYMMWPNIRTFFTYLHDNGYMPRTGLFKK